MSEDPVGRGRILGVLRSDGGRGVVRLEDRYAAGVADVWSALTEPVRLARWFGQVTGDLRLAGEFRLYLESDDVESTGRVEACEPPRRLVITTRETEESYRKGLGTPPFDEIIDVTVTTDGDLAVLVAEVRGLPLDKIEYYGAGWQIHAENLAAYLAGDDRGDVEGRWEQILPAYQAQAARIR